MASGEHGDFIEILSAKSENGMCQEWRKKQRNTLQLQSLEQIGMELYH